MMVHWLITKECWARGRDPREMWNISWDEYFRYPRGAWSQRLAHALLCAAWLTRLATSATLVTTGGSEFR